MVARVAPGSGALLAAVLAISCAGDGFSAGDACGSGESCEASGGSGSGGDELGGEPASGGASDGAGTHGDVSSGAGRGGGGKATGGAPVATAGDATTGGSGEDGGGSGGTSELPFFYLLWSSLDNGATLVKVARATGAVVTQNTLLGPGFAADLAVEADGS